MQPIVIDRVAWSVRWRWPICLSFTVVSSAKTAEPIEMPFLMLSRVVPFELCIRWGVQMLPREMAFKGVRGLVQSIGF